MPLSSINTGLAQIPDLTDIASPGKLEFQFISLYNAVSTLQQAIDTYTGNTPAAADSSNQNAPPEQTVIVGNTCNMWCVAGQNINAGYLVYLYNSGGVTNAKLAQGNNMTTLAHGISMGNAAAGAKLQVLLFGLFNFGGSVTPGQRYWTSDSVPGGLVVTAPANPGDIVQVVGYGVDTNSIFFLPNLQPVQI